MSVPSVILQWNRLYSTGQPPGYSQETQRSLKVSQHETLCLILAIILIALFWSLNTQFSVAWSNCPGNSGNSTNVSVLGRNRLLSVTPPSNVQLDISKQTQPMTPYYIYPTWLPQMYLGAFPRTC